MSWTQLSSLKWAVSIPSSVSLLCMNLLSGCFHLVNGSVRYKAWKVILFIGLTSTERACILCWFTELFEACKLLPAEVISSYPRYLSFSGIYANGTVFNSCCQNMLVFPGLPYPFPLIAQLIMEEGWRLMSGPRRLLTVGFYWGSQLHQSTYVPCFIATSCSAKLSKVILTSLDCSLI